MGREAFAGNYQCTEMTGFDEFMEEMGVPWLVRTGMALFGQSMPALEILLEGDKMTFNLENMPEPQQFMRTLTAGCAPFDHTDPHGVEFTVTVEWAADDFVISLAPKKEGHKGYKVVRSLSANGLTATMIPNGVMEKAMKRTFTRK